MSTSEADIFSYILHLLFLGEVVAFLRYFQPGTSDCSLLGRLTSLDPGLLGWVETKGAVAEQCGGAPAHGHPSPGTSSDCNLIRTLSPQSNIVTYC